MKPIKALDDSVVMSCEDSVGDADPTGCRLSNHLILSIDSKCCVVDDAPPERFDHIGMLTDNFVSCDTKQNVLRATKLAPSQSKRSMRPIHKLRQ